MTTFDNALARKRQGTFHGVATLSRDEATVTRGGYHRAARPFNPELDGRDFAIAARLLLDAIDDDTLDAPILARLAALRLDLRGLIGAWDPDEPRRRR